MEETVISEGNIYLDDVPKFLTEYQQISKQFATHGDYENALEVLAHSEELVEAVNSQGGVIETHFTICTLHNTAFCHSK